jgi:RHS repeat-associated protein
MMISSRRLFLFLLLGISSFLPCHTIAATFTNNASVQVISDLSQSLTSTSGVFTVSCWFRLSIPTTAVLPNNLTLLMDRADGNEAANHCYHIRFNVSNGDVEFVTKGAATYTKTLIQDPYPDRWYHLAIVRNASTFNFYVDGRSVITTPESGSPLIGNAAGSGLSIGGIGGTNRLFRGDIIEVAFYQAALSQGLIQDRMFKDQSSFANIKGYYKLAFSTNSAAFLKNFVPSPATGTDPAVKVGAGNVEFEETDQSGEQSIFDSRKNKGNDSIAPLSGAFSWSQTAFARPVAGIAFDFQFGYGSATPTSAPTDGTPDPYDRRTLGFGWRHSFDSRITADETLKEFRLITVDGGIETFTRSNIFAPFFVRHKEYRGELVQQPSAEVEWTTPDRIVYRFRDPADGTIMAGRLLEIRDSNTNTVKLFWNENEALLTNMVDAAGGQYAFHYDTTRGLLTNVTFGSWIIRFAYSNSSDYLISKSLTNTSGLYTNVNTTWQFHYGANGMLSRIIDPRGFTNVFVQYDQYGRMTNQVDALNRTNHTRYGVPGKRQITRVDPAGFDWIESYDRKGRILTNQDPLLQFTSYTYDESGNRTSITDPLGYTTTFGYDTRANVVASTNDLGQVTRWVFHPFFNKAILQIDALGWTNFYNYDAAGNLTNHFDALGSLVRYSYSTNGLVLSSTDANGNLTSFGYDTNSFLISRTDPANNTSSFGLNDVGWKLSETNALGQVMRYAYDLNGNVVHTLDPLFRTYIKTYDPNGNLTSASDAKGVFTYHYYDPANQRTQTVDRISATNRMFYTTRGSLDRVTDPLGTSITNLYDIANRLVAILDPLGQGVTNIYDANGNVVTNYDKLGRAWVKTYDRLNRVTAESDPLGNTKQTAYDQLGRVSQVITPNGFPSLNYYDGRGRLTNWVDAESFSWRYAYDGVGNITNITDALTNHYVMAYSNRNERILERNQDGKEWRYRYDQLLRLEQQTDPNGLVRTVTYDDVGRVDYVDFSTGRQDNYTYDENNNLTDLSRTKSGQIPVSSHFTLDANDRVTEYKETTFPANNTVKYNYDLLGRIATLTYPGNLTLSNKYDVLSRLTNQVDWAGRQLTYAYDKANRLIQRTYPNGVVLLNAFSESGQLTNLSLVGPNPAIAIAISYAYDRNGNKTASSEAGTFDWPLPSPRDETATYTPSGRLIDKLDAASATNNWTYFYDSSGNMTNAASFGRFLKLTYDEDNRTTSINWEGGISSRLVTNRYDALGRRISRKADNVETRFVLDLQGSMERILCDSTAAGQITAYYIHGPDLCYRVDAVTGGVTYYHSDAQANIIALTDNNTNVVAQYAYTPYGRSLGSQQSSTNSQPYLFVGNQGVMEESDIPGLYFMRARYYLADAGVFLSTDPVKNIGPGWKPVAYSYAGGNPLRYLDPEGTAYFSVGSLGGSFLGDVGKLFATGRSIPALLMRSLNSALYHEFVVFEDQDIIAKSGIKHVGFIDYGLNADTGVHEGGKQANVGGKGREIDGGYDDELILEAINEVGFKYNYSLLPEAMREYLKSSASPELLAEFQRLGWYTEDGINCQEWADLVRSKYRELELQQSRSSEGSRSGGSATITSRTTKSEDFAKAASYASTSNRSTTSRPATTSNIKATTANTGSFTADGGSKSADTQKSRIKNAQTKVKQSITKAVSVVKGYFGKLFGGGKNK